MSGEGKPLRELPNWPEPLIRRLEQNWITTAEQVVAASATPGGMAAMAAHLNVPEHRMRELVDAARAGMPAVVAHALERPADTSQRGLGALGPRRPE